MFSHLSCDGQFDAVNSIGFLMSPPVGVAVAGSASDAGVGEGVGVESAKLLPSPA